MTKAFIFAEQYAIIKLTIIVNRRKRKSGVWRKETVLNKAIARLESISIYNFKNVVAGTLKLENPRAGCRANILGLYGQNGSGKTAVINAIELLRLTLCGKRIPAKFADFININSDHAQLTYRFQVKSADQIYCAVYEFCLRSDNERRIILSDETLSCSLESNDTKRRVKRVIDTTAQNIFAPKTQYNRLVQSSKTLKIDMLVAKKLAATEARSFVFSKELLDVIRAVNENDKESQTTRFIVESLVYFGNFEMFVSNEASPEALVVDNLTIPLNAASTYPEEELKRIERAVQRINIVLTQIFPGLTIGIREIGKTLLENGKIGIQIQPISCRNGREIALMCESKGIKKIISLLGPLVDVYNRESFIAAIDDIDADVFEYLLGEILRVVSKNGKGRLIFTAHDLRPLETLDRNCIAFTTTNPNNRYIHATNAQNNDNFRDFYYRDIILGEQSEAVYDSANNYEIALAFKEAV